MSGARHARRSGSLCLLPSLGLTIILLEVARMETTRADAAEEQTQPPADLIVAYSFDEGTGTTATDFSGNGRNGTLVGPTWAGVGRFGSALSFDGVNDRVTGPVVTLPSTFTFMAWLFNPANAPYETLVTVGTARDLYLGSGIAFFHDGSNDRSFGPAIPANSWQHLALVSDGAALRAYVGGVARGTAQPSVLPSATGAIQIGAWLLGGSSYDFFGGQIDELRIFNRALSQVEIQNLMNVPVSPPPDTVPPTVTLTEPAAGAGLSGQVTARASASDAGGVAGVQFLLDGAPIGPEDLAAPFELAWDTTTTTNGSHTLSARARDTAGNLGTSAASTVTVQNTQIVLTLTAPAAGATTVGTLLNVRYTISVPPPHTYHAHFRLDGGATVMDIDGDGTYQLSGVPVGAHTLIGIVAAQDHSEIPNSDMTVTFTSVRDPSDADPPTVILTAPGAGATVVNTVEVRADAFDNIGLSSVQFFVDGAPLPSGGSASTSWNTTTASDGAHTLTALARDIAGNETLSLPVGVTVANAPGSVSQVGQWSGVIPWPLAPVHSILQPSGEVLLWDQGFGTASARLWNPGTGAMTAVPLDSINNIFCSGHTLLADGRTAVIGGQVNPCCYNGTRETNVFDASTRSWSRMQDMTYRRWYPTAMTLPDGRVLAVSGTISPTLTADTPEIFDPDTNTWTPLTTATLRIPLYPFMFVLPDGRVFNAGPEIQTRVLDIASGTWTDVGSSFTTGHGAVMYGAGRIMKAGTLGDLDNPLPSVNGITAVIDMTQSAPAWRQVAPMAFPRAYHTLTILADGTVIAVGGERTTNGGNIAQAVYDPEVWNPVSETWATVARMQRPRLYHSTALLLPDARVLVSGGDLAPYLESNAEIYSPPYLFRGPRPTISGVPQTLGYGTNVPIDTPDAAAVAKVSLVRLGSVTHGVDQNQRYLELPFTRVGQRLNALAPGGANLAPPGHYMLFLIGVTGAPSMAAIVRLVPSVDPEPPTAPSNLSATPAGGAVNLVWTASTDNVAVTRYHIHRGGAPGVSPSSANRVGQSAAPAYADGTATPATYYYVVVAEDAAGNLSGPSNEVVATVVDASPPVLSNGQPSGSLPSGTTQTTMSAATDEAATCRFSTTAGTAFAAMTGTFVTTGATSHSTLVTGLADGNGYVRYVRCQDAAGNANTSDFPIAFSVASPPVDTTPPVLSNGGPTGVLPAGTTSANLTLQTNEAATCRYSTAAGTIYDAMTSGFTTGSGTSHSATVTGLTNGGSFTFFARCRDSAGNTNAADFTINFSVATPPGSTLRVEYAFDATSGTSAVDSSGNASHGTVSGATWAQGRYAGGLSFDGNNDRVTGPTLALGAQFTFTAWIFNPSNTAYETLITVGTQRDFYLGSGRLRFYGNNADRTFSGPAVATNTWHHVALVSNGTTLRAYLNGAPYGNVLNVALGAFSGRMDVGAWNTTADVFAGRIDQVRVYTTALTQAQIQQDLAAIIPQQP